MAVKRMLLLDDDEMLLVISWAQVARSASDAPALPTTVVAHDFEDDDEAVLSKIEAARLR